MAIYSLKFSPLVCGWTEWGQWNFVLIPFSVCVVGTAVVAMSIQIKVEEPTPTAVQLESNGNWVERE